MLNFIANRRFNYIDSLSTGVTVALSLHGQWIAVLVCVFVGVVVSVTAEHFAGVK